MISDRRPGINVTTIQCNRAITAAVQRELFRPHLQSHRAAHSTHDRQYASGGAVKLAASRTVSHTAR